MPVDITFGDAVIEPEVTIDFGDAVMHDAPGSEVERVKTPLGEMDAAVLVLALAPEFIPGIGREGARLILAHTWGLELNRGKGAFGRNIGNIMAAGYPKVVKDCRNIKGAPAPGKEAFTKPNSYWKGDYWRPPWFADRTHKLHAAMLAGCVPSAFRAYDSYKDSLSDYLRLAVSRKLIAAGALSGHAFEFAKGVWDSGYCQDPPCAPSVLTESLKKLSHEFGEKNYFQSLPSVVSPESKGSTMLLAALTLGITGAIFWGTVKGKKS